MWLPAGSYTVRHRARGVNLILSPEASLAVRVDPDPPVAAAAARPGRGKWTITVTAEDAASGVATISYRVDGGRWRPYRKPLALTGGHRITYRATDRAGNVSRPGTLVLRHRTAAAGQPG